MTFRTESRITIDAPAGEVCAYICDVARWPEWAPTVLRCWVRDGVPLQPGATVDQRAKEGPIWPSHNRSQQVTALNQPHDVAFGGPMGTSRARWGMTFDPADDARTDTMMWIEVDLAGVMRAIPARFIQGSVQRVSNAEMVAIKAAVEADARRGAATVPGEAAAPQRQPGSTS